MLPPENEKSKNWSERALAVSTIVMAVASVLNLFAIILTNIAVLPVWLVYFPVFVFVVALFFLVYSNSGRALRRWRERAIARSHFRNLLILSKEFLNFTVVGMNDTIVYALGNIREGQPSMQNRELADLSYWIAGNLITRLETCRRRYKEFSAGVHDLHALAHSFHRAYLIDRIEQVRRLGVSAVTDDDKRIIEVARESFARYLERFQSFCIEINESVGRQEFNFHFQKAKPL